MRDVRAERSLLGRALAIGLWCALAALAPRFTTGQQPPAERAAVPEGASIVDVRITGNDTVSTASILREVHSRTGRTLDVQTIEDDVRRLNKLRKFVSVETLYQPHPQGVVVIFQVLERPTIKYVKFIGCYECNARQLDKQAGLAIGQPVDPYSVDEGRQKIETFYKERGFGKVQVTVHEGAKPGDRGVVYLIHEGPKQRIKKVEFVGCEVGIPGRLKTQIESKPPLLWLFNGEVDLKKIDDDVDKLTSYYRSLGFFQARIGRELSYSDSGWATLSFVIHEGPRYKIRNVTVMGTEKISVSELTPLMLVKQGDPFDQAALNASLSGMRDKYGSQGYVFADVKADPRFLEQPGELDLVFNISEGKRYRVGRVFINIKGRDGGSPNTKTTTVLNRISLQPGDICDTRELRMSERRLKSSGLFLNNPAQGATPKITFSVPESAAEEMMAEGGGKADDPPQQAKGPSAGVRGQSPDPVGGAFGSRWQRSPHAVPTVDIEINVVPDAVWASMPNHNDGAPLAVPPPPVK